MTRNPMHHSHNTKHSKHGDYLAVFSDSLRRSRHYTQRWVVQQPSPLHQIVHHLDPSKTSLCDGRVFVNGKRETCGDRVVAEGTVVDVFAPTSSAASPCANRRSCDDGYVETEKPKGNHAQILQIRQGLVAAYKPCAMSTIADQRGWSSSLQAWVAEQLGIKDIARVHPSSRLDRDVSGVVVFATDKPSREALAAARKAGRYLRHYIALCSTFACSTPKPRYGIINAAIGRSNRPTQRQIYGKNAVPARTHYATIATAGPVRMIAAEPQTGRTHQIRLHLAHIGAPIWGDNVYGSGARITSASGAIFHVHRIALHAAWVQIALSSKKPHNTTWHVDAPIPAALADIWKHVDGDESSWQHALLPIVAI